MMLLIHRSEQLPDKRHLLYDKCIYNLLNVRPEVKGSEGALLPIGNWRPIDSDERMQRVARLAYNVQSGGFPNRGQYMLPPG
jgi:hypothetical protein